MSEADKLRQIPGESLPNVDTNVGDFETFVIPYADKRNQLAYRKLRGEHLSAGEAAHLEALNNFLGDVAPAPTCGHRFLIPEELERLHALPSKTKITGKRVACYYCQSTSEGNAVDWCGDTPTCPNCGIDSIFAICDLPKGVDLYGAICQMNGRWFGQEIPASELSIQKFLSACEKIRTSKGRDYTIDQRDANPLYNFIKVAEQTGCSPEQVWSVYFMKHVYAVLAWAKTGKVESEGIDGRFMDIVNYAILGWQLSQRDKCSKSDT